MIFPSPYPIIYNPGPNQPRFEVPKKCTFFSLYFRTLELCLDGMMSRLLESLVCLCH